MSSLHEVLFSDVTGQRSARSQVGPDTPVSALTAQGVDLLDLPLTRSTNEPVIYHSFEQGGNLLPGGDRVSDVIRRYRLEAELRIRVIPELESARAS